MHMHAHRHVHMYRIPQALVLGRSTALVQVRRAGRQAPHSMHLPFAASGGVRGSAAAIFSKVPIGQIMMIVAP